MCVCVCYNGVKTIDAKSLRKKKKKRKERRKKMERKNEKKKKRRRKSGLVAHVWNRQWNTVN